MRRPVLCGFRTLLRSGNFSYLAPMKQFGWSKSILVLAVLVIAVLRVFVADSSEALTWDVFGYYLYLPAYFIYDDLTLQNMDWVQHIIDTYHSTGTLYQAVQVESGNWVMRYPGGLALLNLPAFTVADLLAEPLGYARDGFSKPYQLAWVLSGMAYAFVGLIFSRKFLLRYFSDRWTAVLLFILVFTTNYLEIATFANPLAHNYLFALYAMALYLMCRVGEKVSWRQGLLLGLLIGLITMCRPNEGLFVLVPLLWIWNPLKLLRSPGSYFSNKGLGLLALGLGLFLGGLPQMQYWKAVSGQWLFYSYQDNGVGFDFLSPHTWDFLFSYRKGWLVYTPVMLFACLGFVWMWRRNRELFVPFFLFFLVNLYVVSSWSVWWYGGGSYSSRSMVSSYLMLIMPLGYLLQWVREKGNTAAWTSRVLIALMTVLNLFQFWQFKAKIIDGERMTGAYYWKIFGRTSIPAGAESLLLVERQAEAIEHMPEDKSHLNPDILHETWLGVDAEQENQVALEWPDESLERVVQLDPEHPYTRAFEAGMEEITGGEYAWLRISAEVYVPDSAADAPMLVCHFNYKDKPYKYSTTEYQIPGIRKGEWQRISMDYMTPEVRNRKDYVKIYLWYRGAVPVYARSLKVERYVPKGG